MTEFASIGLKADHALILYTPHFKEFALKQGYFYETSKDLFCFDYGFTFLEALLEKHNNATTLPSRLLIPD